MFTQSYLTLGDPVDYSPPDSFFHGIFQARLLEWVAISFSRGSSWPKDWTWDSCVSCIGRWIVYLGSPDVSLWPSLIGQCFPWRYRESHYYPLSWPCEQGISLLCQWSVTPFFFFFSLTLKAQDQTWHKMFLLYSVLLVKQSQNQIDRRVK